MRLDNEAVCRGADGGAIEAPKEAGTKSVLVFTPDDVDRQAPVLHLFSSQPQVDARLVRVLRIPLGTLRGVGPSQSLGKAR